MGAIPIQFPSQFTDFMCLSFLPASVYVHTCVRGATEDRRGHGPLEVEFQTVVSTIWMLRTKLGPLLERWVFFNH